MFVYYLNWPRTQLSLKNVDKLIASVPESQPPAIFFFFAADFYACMKGFGPVRTTLRGHQS